MASWLPVLRVLHVLCGGEIEAATVAIYIGFDSSTQSLTAIAIDVEGDRRDVVFERALAFDEAFPEYGTRRGVVPSDDPLIGVAPPLMWADALDRMMGEIARSGLPLAEIRAISGSGQQHGSVYLAEGAGDRLGRLDPRRGIVEQIRGLLSRELSPIWMDTSTGAECAAITEGIGGAGEVIRLTGSRACERFTGPQIRKFAAREPLAYARTECVHLVSSFLASLLVGRHAPLDPGDASGTSLMDLAARSWSPAAVRATAADLARKLPEIRPSSSLAGPLAPYWTGRYGFPAAAVATWSGDNPCSLIGTGLVREGRLAISLGTSDTVFGFMREPRVDPSGAGHVFGSPTGDFMGLTCFKNGSLARERMRDAYGLDWAGFSDALRRTPAGNGGAVMLPWFDAEITPPMLTPGVRRFGLDPADAAANVRAVVEGQMIAMALHSQWMGVDVDTIRATGGASVNREVLAIIADVFDADVYQLSTRNSAALGAALRAFHADLLATGRQATWDEVIDGFVEPVAESRVQAHPDRAAAYEELKDVYAEFESEALRTDRRSQSPGGR